MGRDVVATWEVTTWDFRVSKTQKCFSHFCSFPFRTTVMNETNEDETVNRVFHD